MNGEFVSFEEFPKIPRYRREIAVTEKLDGSNAAVCWHPVGEKFSQPALDSIIATRVLTDQHQVELGEYHLLAQSRSRFIVPARILPKADNFGFATWVDAHVDELTKLGPGVHYGEWWGYGIQRGYGLAEKRFSLFNVNRWGDGKQERPACCHVVPLIGYFLPHDITAEMGKLIANGSYAAPGYMRPEGLILWHSQSKNYFKILCEGDDHPKGVQCEG